MKKKFVQHVGPIPKCPVCDAEATFALLTELNAVGGEIDQIHDGMIVLKPAMKAAVACANCGVVRLVDREFDFDGNRIKK